MNTESGETALRQRAQRMFMSHSNDSPRHAARVIVVWLVALLVVGGGEKIWLARTHAEAAAKLAPIAADPGIPRAKTEEEIDRTFERKRGELLQAKAPIKEILALYRWRDQAKAQVADAAFFISAQAGDPKSPIIRKATAVLNERGVDAALEFLDATLKTERQRRNKEGRQLAEALLMKAGLHKCRLESDAEERAIRDAIANDPGWWRPHNGLGLLLQYRAQWQSAEQEHEAARKFAHADAEIAPVLASLAQLYQATNRLAEAEPLMKRALKIDEKIFGPDHPNVATEVNNLAQLYQATNRLAEAEPLMERALKIDEKRLGPEDPDVARDLINLAGLYRETNRLAEAEPLIERALKIAVKIFGPDHPNVVKKLNNLANLYFSTNRLAEAEPLMERALKIDEKNFGPEHPDVARDLNNLAQLYQATNRLAKAEPLMERALKIDEQSYGPEHSDVARDLTHLAKLYYITNRLAVAEPLMERALKIDEKNLGPEHPNVAINLNNLAQLYQASNRLAKAEPLMERALKIAEKSYGPEHPEVAIKLNNLAMYYVTTHRLAEAEPRFRRAVVILLNSTRASGHVLPDLKLLLSNYIHVLGDMSLSEAEVAQRVMAAGRKAGFTPEEFAALYEGLRK